MTCLAAMLLGQKDTGVWKPLQWLMGSLRHGGDEFKIIRAGKAALATQRVPYQGRLDKDRTESRIFHLTNHRSVLMSRPCIGDVDCIDSRVHESLSSALSTTGSTDRHPVSTYLSL